MAPKHQAPIWRQKKFLFIKRNKFVPENFHDVGETDPVYDKKLKKTYRKICTECSSIIKVGIYKSNRKVFHFCPSCRSECYYEETGGKSTQGFTP